MVPFRFFHLKTLHHVFPGDIHELMNGLPQLPHAFGQRAEVQIPWQIAFFHPVLEALTIGYREKGRLLPYVLVGKVVQEIGPSVQTLGGWRHGIPFFQEHPRPDFRYIKLCPDLWSKFIAGWQHLEWLPIPSTMQGCPVVLPDIPTMF